MASGAVDHVERAGVRELMRLGDLPRIGVVDVFLHRMHGHGHHVGALFTGGLGLGDGTVDVGLMLGSPASRRRSTCQSWSAVMPLSDTVPVTRPSLPPPVGESMTSGLVESSSVLYEPVCAMPLDASVSHRRAMPSAP